MYIRGINHVVLKVRDLEASDTFYRGVLGLNRIGERGRMWFYSAGSHNHDLALLQVPGNSLNIPYSGPGLFHLCFDVQDEGSLALLHQRCVKAGVPILGAADHVIMRSFYVADPEGNLIELGFDTPVESWQNLSNPFAVDKPYQVSIISDEAPDEAERSSTDSKPHL